jgi:hypothetical protein
MGRERHHDGAGGAGDAGGIRPAAGSEGQLDLSRDGSAGLVSLRAGRRALLLLSVGPVWLAEAVICWGLWPSRRSAIHLVALGLLGMILAEICLLRFRKIPFACSYLPGKSRFHMVIPAAFGLLLGSVKGVLLERQALRGTGGTAAMMVLLIAVWVCVRWMTEAQARGEEQELRFEEEEPPAVQGLGLARDGVMPIGALPQAARTP